jgi:hypothetical protein
MTDRVDVPQFELVGPSCQHEGCTGVLVDCLTLDSKEFFQRCSECRREFNRQPAAEKLAWAVRSIKRILRGEKKN